MKDTMVRIMVEVLSILAIATKEIKQNRTSKPVTPPKVVYPSFLTVLQRRF